jgi:hypothetical protein
MLIVIDAITFVCTSVQFALATAFTLRDTGLISNLETRGSLPWWETLEILNRVEFTETELFC